MYIPYSWLSGTPQGVIVCGDIPVYFRLTEQGGRTCLITLSKSHAFQGGPVVTMPVGSVFELEYKGLVCEIQLGRRMVVCDGAA
jgi:hypothetical protein